MDSESIILPKKNNIKQTYEDNVPVLKQIMSNVEHKLRHCLKLSSQPTYKSRIKSFESYYRKVLRLKADKIDKNNTFIELSDMMGIRVICAFLEDLSEVERQVKEVFEVKEVEYKGSQQSFREFGYESVHILVAIPDDCKVDGYDDKFTKNLVCEIQIRTILQDAWAEVEHELIYKTEFSPFDMPLRRKLAAMNASLSLADIIFQEIRDYQKNLQHEVDQRRTSFYEQADIFTRRIIPDAGITKAEESIARVNPYVKGTIDDLILEAMHAHNRGEFDRAVSIYTQILTSEPVPADPVMAVIYKHRGMAYFATSDYDNALKDFEASVKHDTNGFRSYYYIGIVYGVTEEHEKAIEAFTKSISLNSYQSHAHFRRAVSYYWLGEYSKAMSDIGAAQALGLDTDELKVLNEKVVEKLDMGM